MTNQPRSTTTGRHDGHALYLSPVHSDAAGAWDDLLLTPVAEEDFLGTPYPAPGSRVRTRGAGPPWLVVDHALDRIVVSTWPVRLWRVRDVDSADEAHQVAAWYTRATGVTIAEELPASTLFGSHGAAVAAVLEYAGQLGPQHASRLAQERDANAAKTYADAWRR